MDARGKHTHSMMAAPTCRHSPSQLRRERAQHRPTDACIFQFEIAHARTAAGKKMFFSLYFLKKNHRYLGRFTLYCVF